MNENGDGRIMKKALLVIVLIAVLSLLMLFAFRAQKAADSVNITGAGTAEHAVQEQTALMINGKEVPLKDHLSTLLIIGTDNFNDRSEGTFDAFYNYQQADFQTVLVFDDDAKTCTPIQINRDSMFDVFWLSVNGKVGGTDFCQMALSHTYGSGKNDSCVNTRNTVSAFLHDAPIDKYMAFTMDAVPILNDIIGGVEVTVPGDYTDADPSFTEGARITLIGDKALKFVRTRDIMIDDSNLDRMSRQRLYLQAFAESAKNAIAKDDSLVLRAYDRLADSLVTDVTPNDISAISKKLQTYEIRPVLTPDGELKLGTRYAEFYVSQESLDEIVRNIFCR